MFPTPAYDPSGLMTAGVAVAAAGLRRDEVGMVEDIEDFRAELDIERSEILRIGKTLWTEKSMLTKVRTVEGVSAEAERRPG